ncbi:sensor histidine kinase [Lacrimispora amygdalina]|uniref:histidine kinase n=1 Tax=Lacrimispora amygdalina TaxID=253257 RepID=A0A3E2NE73_9FIRM|nr:LytS/YhcK type 5TM receptor domain-containing protein [Clostridium indicum]RFZ79317.1 sensor histidine kinase [Clostridium indicum]
MSSAMFFSLLLNIGLLVLIAALLTKIPIVRSMLLYDKHSAGCGIMLALIFGSISIISTYTGVRAQGAIVNTRVIGVLAAGLLGGPYVGMGAALIGGIHRYLFDIGGFTAAACAVSTLVEGIAGSIFSSRFKAGKIGSTGVFFLTVFVEFLQMVIILLISRPFSAAVQLVKLISLPMMTMNALGMLVFLGTFNMVFLEEDSQFAERMRLALGIVEQSLPHLRKGLHSTQDIQAVAEIIFQSTSCSAILITDSEKILGMKKNSELTDMQENSVLPPILASTHDRKPTVFHYAGKGDPLYSVLKNHVIVAAPIIEMNQVTGSLTMVLKKHWQQSQSDLNLASELARLFSTQFELSELEYQKKLRQKAELKALQSQVNPHFLYNSLNTISYVCRENPDRARELLLTLSSYYRQTLEHNSYMHALKTELQHITSYLELEKARFEEKLHIEIKTDEKVNCFIPAFILQPLVENAIRYGFDKNGNRYVSICACMEGAFIKISVSDRGPGIPEAIIHQLYHGEHYGGVGLENVHKRLKSIYGQEHGLHIQSSDSGSDISFTIPASSESKYDDEEYAVTREKDVLMERRGIYL